MNLHEVIAQLHIEREKIEQAIEILESLANARPRPRGRPRKTLNASRGANHRILEQVFPRVSSAGGN